MDLSDAGGQGGQQRSRACGAVDDRERRVEHLDAEGGVGVVERPGPRQQDERAEPSLIEGAHGGEQVGVRAAQLCRRVDVENCAGAHARLLTTRAGLPTAMEAGGISRVTTEPAPTTDRAPKRTPSRTITLFPSQHPSSTTMPRRLTPCSLIARVGSSNS